jgi:hypothetical protein
MGWLVIVIIGYLPIIYRIHRRLDFLEKEVERLSKDNESRRSE